PSVPPAARYAAWNRGPQCTPSASRVPPKSKRTTSVDLVMPVARVLVRRRPHGHAPRHPHLVPAALPHVVAIVQLIQRVRAVGGRPLDATVGHEPPGSPRRTAPSAPAAA